jgi:hypothetical protein
MKTTYSLAAILTVLLLAPCAALHAADVHKLLPRDWDPKAAGDKVMAGLTQITPPKVKGAHGAKLLMIGDRAFVSTLANDVRGGHDFWDFQYAALIVVNLKTGAVERFLKFAESSQAFANETLPASSCFASGMLRVDEHTLRCFFSVERPGRGQSQMYYRDFDLRTQTFAESVHRAKLKTSTGVFDLQPQHLHADAAKHGFPKPAKDNHLELLDSFKKFDGRTYAVLNSFIGALNALIVFNEAGDTLEVVGHYNEPFDLSLTESAVNRLPDGTWMAICRQEGGDKNYLFTTSRDGRVWTRAEPRAWVNKGTNSKPTFDKFGGVYYLGWQEATPLENVSRRRVFNVDVSTDGATWERKYRFESTQSFQYPAFTEHEGAVWVTVTQGTNGSTDRIMFGKLEDLLKSPTKQGN